MPTPRKHVDAAARQRDYRKRRKLARINAPCGQALPLPKTSGRARWAALRRQAETALKQLFQEMEEYRDERSDAWHESERADAFQERLDNLEEVIQAIQDIE